MPWDSQWPICSRRWTPASAPLSLCPSNSLPEDTRLYEEHYPQGTRLYEEYCPLVKHQNDAYISWSSPFQSADHSGASAPGPFPRRPAVPGGTVGLAHLGYP